MICIDQCIGRMVLCIRAELNLNEIIYPIIDLITRS